MTELTVREMPEVLICVEACLWKMIGVDLVEELMSSPLRRTTYSPEGTSVKVTRKVPLSSDWRAQPDIGVTFFFFYIEQSHVNNKVFIRKGKYQPMPDWEFISRIKGHH